MLVLQAFQRLCILVCLWTVMECEGFLWILALSIVTQARCLKAQAPQLLNNGHQPQLLLSLGPFQFSLPEQSHIFFLSSGRFIGSNTKCGLESSWIEWQRLNMNISEQLEPDSHPKQPFGSVVYSNISQVRVQFSILMKWHTGIIQSEGAME